MSDHTALHVAIIEHLNHLLEQPGELDYDSLEVATQCLTEALQVDLSSDAHKQFLLRPKDSSIADIFQGSAPPAAATALKGEPGSAQHWNAYLQSQLGNNTDLFVGSEEYNNRVREIAFAYQNEFGVKLHSVITGAISDEDKAQAEEFKTKGNQLLGQGDYIGAIDNYNHAIRLNPENHVYFANRGLAYYKLNRFQEALKDCQQSIKLNGSYSKAYYRLGQTYAVLERYEDAIAEFKRAANVARGNNETTLVAEIEQQCRVVENDMRRKRNPQQHQQQQQQQQAPGLDLNNIMSNPMFANIMQGLMGGANNGGGAGGGMDLASMMSSLGAMTGNNNNAGMGDDQYDDDGYEDDEYSDEDGNDGSNNNATTAGGQADLVNKLMANPQIASILQNDPALSAAANDIAENGLEAGLRHLTPDVIAKLGPILSQLQSGNQ